MPEANTHVVTLMVQFEVTSTVGHGDALAKAEAQLAPALVLTRKNEDVRAAKVIQSSIT
jgi:hypothetical protein